MGDFICGKPPVIAFVCVLVAGTLSIIRVAVWTNGNKPHVPQSYNTPYNNVPDPKATIPNRTNSTNPPGVSPNPNPAVFFMKSDNSFAVAPKTDPDGNRGLDPNFLNTGVLQAWYGQEKELAATCNRTLRNLKDTNNPALAERAAKICSLRPMDDKTQETALVLARRAVELGKKSQFLAHFEMALGMAEYRAGNYENADAALLEASRLAKDNYHVSVTTEFYRAMSLFRQVKEAESQELAEDAVAKMKPLPIDERNPLVGKNNIDDLVLWMAYKEAKELLKLTR